MSLPFFSAICLTYGDVPQLEDSLGCFLAQDYKGLSEVIVLNSFPRQKLICADPRVVIANLSTRPASLAECRNYAAGYAGGTHLVTWDSDDAFAPWYLSTIAKNFEGGQQWVWLDKQFFLENWKIRDIVPGSMNALVFTKDAWTKVGGYKVNLSVGEDREFATRITTQTPGKRVVLTPEEIGFFYSWGEKNFHISGQGDDQPGKTKAYERVRVDLERRVARGLVPVGEVTLNPKMKHDYGQMARDYVSSTRIPVEYPKTSVAVVLLGRTGDLINFLPVLRHIAETYAKPHLVVSREFAQLLEGVSYVEPYPVDLPNDKLLPAIKIAKERFKHVLVAQPWSKDVAREKKTPSYNMDAWDMAGFANKFNDPTWFPVFDRRNLAREEALWTKLNAPGKPMILVKLDGSISSPWPNCPKLIGPITEAFGLAYNIVNLSTVRAERVYDLLGLFSRAVALVTIDTAILHLAAAGTLPHVALVNPQPWLGTLPRGCCVRRMTYSEAETDPSAVIKAIRDTIDMPGDVARRRFLGVGSPPKRTIWHVYEVHDGATADTRVRKARMSWEALYQQGVVPRPLAEYPRDARAIGDSRALPYLKDVLKFATTEAGDEDLIMFTNDDVVLHPEIVERLLFHCSIYGPVSSQRCEFKRQMPVMSKPPGTFALLGGPHMGRDLFCFPKRWLVDHWNDIPDFILGASAWDLCIAAMVRLEYGIVTTRQNIAENILPAEIERGYVSHEWHRAHWSKPENAKAPSRKWNNQCFKDWAGKFLPTLRFNAENEI